MKCPKCKFSNPKVANFCLKCGTPLTAPEVAERKFVTILFSDLKEFTTLSEQKDPEEMREIIKELFSRFDIILENFNVGYHEYIGDAVIALFGVPVAHPDDAELAIDAALSMQKEIKDFSAEIGVPLEFRTGINSGEVIYGQIPGKTTVTGDAVNTTQRISSIAEPGKILISDTTAGLTSGKIRTRPLPPVKLKGKKNKILVFEVISHSKKIYPSFLSPILGRNQELAKLKEIIETNNNSSFTIVAGDIGVGKSRLIFEFQKNLMQKVKAIPLRTGPYSILIYHPLIDLIKTLLNIGDSESTETIKKKIEETSLIIEKDPLSKHFLGFFLGIKFPNSPLNHLNPADARQSAFITLKNLIEYNAKKIPLLLIFKDAHYIDSGTKSFIEYLAQSEFQNKIMILLTGRIEGFIEEIKNYKKKNKWNFVELFPLKESESKALIKSFFKEKELSNEVIETLFKKTGGNPLFLEEFIKDLKSGIDYNLSELPNSLWALLEARIDRLPSNARKVLRTASVIGKTFWKGTLETLLENKLEKELILLEQKDYIYEQSSSRFKNDREYIFRHELLRDAAYKTLLKKQRREFHRKILNYIEEKKQREKIQPELYLQLAAYHSEFGEEYNKAVNFYTESGDLAKARYASQEAINAYTKAIEILTQKISPDYNIQLGKLFKKRASTETFLSLYDKAIEDYEKLTKFKNSEMKILGLIGIAYISGRKGDFDKTIEYSLSAKVLAEKQGIKELKGEALNDLSFGYYRKGLYKKGLKMGELAHKIYSELISTETKEKDLSLLKLGLGKSLNNIGNNHLAIGNYDKALNFYMRSLKISKKIDDKNGIAGKLSNIGIIHMDLGNYHEALDFHKQSLEIGKEISNKHRVGLSLNDIGVVYDEIEEEDKALEFYNQALTINKEVGNKALMAVNLHNIGTIHFKFGNYDMALDFYNQSLKINREIGSKRGIALDVITIGEIYGDYGNYKVALNYQKEAEKIMRKSEMKLWLVYCLNSKGILYKELKNFPEASKNLEEALNISKKLNLKSEMCETLSLLAQVNFAMGEEKLSKNCLEKGLRIAKKCKSKTSIRTLISTYVKFHLYTHNYTKAKETSKKLLDLFTITKCKNSSYAEALYFMGKSLYELGEKNKAKEYFSQSLSLAKKMKLNPLLDNLSKVL